MHTFFEDSFGDSTLFTHLSLPPLAEEMGLHLCRAKSPLQLCGRRQRWHAEHFGAVSIRSLKSHLHAALFGAPKMFDNTNSLRTLGTEICQFVL